MNRIRAIVDQGKQELELMADPKAISSVVHPKIAGRVVHHYRTTQSVKVSAETLHKNRLIAQEKGNPCAKQFQVLRAKVLQEMRKRKWTTVAISSPTQNAGKSLVAANLALSMALEGNQSVLLVDMDLTKPSIHHYFGLKPELGLLDYFEGTAKIEDMLIHPCIDRLVILPGRKGIVGPSEQASSPMVKDLVDELKSRYESRVVIFDLPPILGSDEVMIFSPYVDCSLLVVEAGKNTPRDVEKSLEVIGANPILGTILNKSENAWLPPGYY